MATNTTAKRIVVAGGNGFLGSRICKSAVTRGWTVTSLSRSGEPQWNTVTSSSTPPPWAQSVQWMKADILSPASYRSHLEGADAVVHTMGVLLEADYKGVLTGKESPISGLQRAFSAVKKGTRNPLEKGVDDLKPEESDGQLTYEVMNRDTAVLLAKEAAEKDVKTFVYISAAAGFALLPKRYITTKREAEDIIASEFPRMRSSFLRPGFLYDSSRGFTVPLAALTSVAAAVNGLTGKRLGWLMGSGGEKPLKADLVAEAVVEAIGNEEVHGPIETAEIEMLANQAWRRGML